MALPFLRLSLFALILLALPSMAQAAIDQDYPSVQIQTLDKATARTNTVTVDVGQTVEFGSLFIKVQACRKSGPLDQPESAAFLQIWEVPINAEKSEWIFSGWMFASSPALSAMDHPVYDVWVLDCAGGEEKPTSENNVSVKIDGVEVDLEAPLSEGDVVTEENLEDTENNGNESDSDLGATINSLIKNLSSGESGTAPQDNSQEIPQDNSGDIQQETPFILPEETIIQ